jgi:hypothetical protein
MLGLICFFIESSLASGAPIVPMKRKGCPDFFRSVREMTPPLLSLSFRGNCRASVSDAARHEAFHRNALQKLFALLT